MMVVNKPIRIIRTLWGKNFSIHKEIPKKPIFGKNEYVFVWGNANTEFLKNLGYQTLPLHYNDTFDNYNTHLHHYGHKLEALKLADELFDEYLFLDWDVGIVKDIDDRFWELVRSGNDVQCPIYAYNKNYINDILDWYTKKGTLTKNIEDFLKYHIKGLNKYSWQTEDLYILPNFCYFYSNKSKVATRLYEIMNKNNLDTCIEEFAMWIYSNCSLDEYISKYEPQVIRGKERDVNLPNMDLAFKTINEYVGERVKKEIYLYHELQTTTN